MSRGHFTPTGRWVHDDPNIQHLPIRTPEAAAIRAAFLEEGQSPMKIERLSQLTGFTIRSMRRHKRNPAFVEIVLTKVQEGVAGAPRKIIIVVDADEFFDMEGSRIQSDVTY